ncbi:MAG: hypothetical protein KDD22_08170, partial [Bdellovibrionales bacterium]|nr:hypothetical protein [Bdellovibrionales bacterium]
LNGMVTKLENSGASWQMCYTTTHVALNPEAGQVMTWKKTNASNKVVSTNLKVLSNNTANKENLFLTTMGNMAVGKRIDGSGAEQGIAATRIAIDRSDNKDCFRDDAAIAAIYMTDEDEASCGGRCKNKADEPDLATHPVSKYKEGYIALSNYNQFDKLLARLQEKWSKKAFTGHAIVIKPGDKDCWKAQDSQDVAFYGKEYNKLRAASGGILGDICASSYASQLNKIATRIVESTSSVTLRCTPSADPTVVVTPSPGTLNISYSGNKIFFDPALESGDQVTVTYRCK